MTLLEAMSLGKPCVVTDAGGNAEVITNNEIGLVVANNDKSAFAKAMLQLNSDNALYNQFSEAAHLRFEKNFSVESMCTAFQAIYKRLMQEVSQ